MSASKKFARILLYIALILFVSVTFYILGSNTTFEKPFSINLDQSEQRILFFSVICAVADWIALFKKKKSK